MIELTFKCSECLVEAKKERDFPHAESCPHYVLVSSEKFMDVWRLPMETYDDLTFVGEHCQDLLKKLLLEGESFDGKRPFGNSGWFTFFEIAFVKHGVVKGDLNETGDNLWCNDWTGDSEEVRRKVYSESKRITRQTKQVLMLVIDHFFERNT